jgi:hypothetical protein
MQQVWDRGEVYTGLCWGNQKERDHLEDPGVDGTKMEVHYRNVDFTRVTRT